MLASVLAWSEALVDAEADSLATVEALLLALVDAEAEALVDSELLASVDACSAKHLLILNYLHLLMPVLKH